MSKRSTGSAFEKWCEAWILKNIPNSAVHRQVSVASKVKVGVREIWVSKRNDIFGVIDLVVVSPDIKPMFIQCTCDSSIGRKFKELFAIPWNLKHSDVYVWQKMKGRRVVLWEYDGRAFFTENEIINGKTDEFVIIDQEQTPQRPILPPPKFSDDSAAVLSDKVERLRTRLSRKRPTEDPSPQ